MQNDDPAGGSTALARTDTDDGWFVEKTTGEGRVTTHSVARNVGDEDRTTALPDGTVIASTEDAAGVQVMARAQNRASHRCKLLKFMI